MRGWSGTAITTTAMLLTLGLPAAAPAAGSAASPDALVAPPATLRVSVNSAEGQTNRFGYAAEPAASTDGKVIAFRSAATNLVPGDTNRSDDIFVRDRTTGTTERISVSSAEGQADGFSYAPVISGDGRYVAFYSEADNLAAGDNSTASDVFVRDREAGTTERVSIASDGGSAGPFASSIVPSISADGRYVGFQSESTTLVPGDANGSRSDSFVRDRLLGTTERVNLSSGEEQGDDAAYTPALSGDGRYAAFSSSAANLVPGDTNFESDVFVRDRARGTTERVSVNSSEQQVGSGGFGQVISDDGRFVAFNSSSRGLVAGDTNRTGDVFFRDRDAGTTERVSVSSSEEQANRRSLVGDISADGRHVVFETQATNLVSDTNRSGDIFVRDRAGGTTERASVASTGAQGNEDSYGGASISADGSVVAFVSQASNLVRRDTNDVEDVFVRIRATS